MTVPAPSFREMRQAQRGESSAAVKERVERARGLQRERFATGLQSGLSVVSCNAALGAAEVRRWCKLDRDTVRFLEQASDRMALSGRGVHRVLKVARTIADLDESAMIRRRHLAEAIQYRESDEVQF